MNETYHFTIFGRPITKKNSQRIFAQKGKIRVLPSEQYLEYVERAKQYVPKIDSPINYPVNIKAVFYMPKRDEVDLTNLLEGLDDLLVGKKAKRNDPGWFLHDDNCKIVVSHDGSRVHWDKLNPRVEVTIEPSEEVSYEY